MESGSWQAVAPPIPEPPKKRWSEGKVVLVVIAGVFALLVLIGIVGGIASAVQAGNRMSPRIAGAHDATVSYCAGLWDEIQANNKYLGQPQDSNNARNSYMQQCEFNVMSGAVTPG